MQKPLSGYVESQMIFGKMILTGLELVREVFYDKLQHEQRTL